MIRKGIPATALLASALCVALPAAACVPATIDGAAVAALPVPLALPQVIDRFGQGCFGGMTAMTYQYRDAAGRDVWFWLENTPEPAFERLQRSAAAGALEPIGVAFASLSDGAGNGELLWPASKAGLTMEDAMEATYLRSPR